MRLSSTVIVLMLWSTFSVNGQSLKPIVQLLGKDTVLSFTAIQAKDIAKRISAGEYCEKMVAEYKTEVGILDSLVLVKDRQIVNLKQENRNSVEIYQNQQKVSEGLQKDIKTYIDSQRKNNLITKLSVIGMIVFGAVAILK